MSKHKEHVMNRNSMASYAHNIKSGALKSVTHKIIKLMLGSEPLTDKSISTTLGPRVCLRNVAE